MKLLCVLGFHHWHRVGITMPIRIERDFIEREYIGHKAMGRCSRCQTLSLRGVTGYWEWYHSDEVTAEKYYEEFVAGEYLTDLTERYIV